MPIAYLNLIPLATFNDRIVPEFRAAFERATSRQLELLEPAKVVFYGKGACGMFEELSRGRWPARYIEQRNFRDAPAVRQWLAQSGS